MVLWVLLNGVAGEERFFVRHRGALKLVWPDEPGQLALRSAQFGALFSLAGHVQTSAEPAQAILPTGVGKTAVVCAIPFLVPTKRVLVVVPTRLLRDQIADEFATLSILERLGAVSMDDRPKVERVDHRLGTEEAWEAVTGVDVAVGTPSVLSADNEGVARPPAGLFDLLIFDEAHHLPATTWSAMLGQHHRRAVLVTATAFRRDRKPLPGSIAYHYTLRQAMADRVYAPIRFCGVDAEPDDDEAIARVAVERLNSEEHVAGGSLLLVRTDRIEHARELAGLYSRHGLEVGIITSAQSLRHARQVVAKMREGTLRGVVSVGALVEGFDMPRLKIAAYHRPHRTLAPTLQFIGRIARVTGGAAAAELVAARTDLLTHETSELYQEDALAWSELLPALADAAVEREKAVREYVADSTVDGDQDISAGALRPRRVTQVFDLNGNGTIQLGAELALAGVGRVVFDFVDSDQRLRALILQRPSHPEWMATHALDGYEYVLVVLVHDPTHNLLFAAGPSVATLNQIRDAVGGREAPRLAPEIITRYLASENPEDYSSVGMRATRAPGARLASYRMLAGSSVQGAISDSEARAHAVGHVIGRRNLNGRTHGMGASLRKAKIWETEACQSLLDFRDWCDELAEVLRGGGVAAGIPHLEQLSLQKVLTAFPSNPIAAVLDSRLLQGGIEIRNGPQRHDVSQLDLIATRRSPTQLGLELRRDGEGMWSGLLNLRGEITAVGEPSIRLLNGDEAPVSEVLNEWEPWVYYADGSSTQGGFIFEAGEPLGPPPSSLFEIWDWQGADITKETTQPAGGLLNVQEHTTAWAVGHLIDPLVIVDHNSGEIADVVAIERLPQAIGERVRVNFMHCKASSEARPGARIDDLYEVIGQTVKSARWSQPAVLFKELDRRWRERQSITVESAHDATLVGAALAAWAAQPVECELRVWSIQPGVSRARMEGWANGNTLISAANGWCGSEGVTLRLAVSA